MTTKKSTSNHPKANPDHVRNVHELLVAHTGSTVGKAFLMDSTGIRDERIVRDAVSQIVLGGLGAVVPDRQHGGYKLTADPDEIRAEIAHLTAHKKTVSERCAALRRIARALDAQGGGGVAAA